jgi:rod shape-determining protein MreC
LNSRIPVTFGDEDIQAILKGDGDSKPILEYLPEGFIVEEGIEVFTSGKDGIFFPGSPIGKTLTDGKVKLYSENSQLSFVKIDIAKQHKEIF